MSSRSRKKRAGHASNKSVNKSSEETNEPEASELPDSSVAHKGRSKFTFVDGSSYVGQWEVVSGRKVRHGSGVLQSKSGRYEGAWAHDFPEGPGCFEYANGDRYSGEFVRGRFQGNGTYEWAVQSGNDEKISDGAYQSSTEVKTQGIHPVQYVGEWFGHKMHGEGELLLSTGEKFKGKFAHDAYLSDFGEYMPVRR